MDRLWAMLWAAMYSWMQQQRPGMFDSPSPSGASGGGDGGGQPAVQSVDSDAQAADTSSADTEG